jgi:hypothetical protein
MLTMLDQFDPTWVTAAAIVAIIIGLAQLWQGLLGDHGGKRALLRRRTPMLERMEGFRRAVAGLVLIGVGAAAITRGEWLFYLALGIGFVEILESSTLIAVWRRNRVRPAISRF